MHARLLLTHVPERRRALQAMADSLSPGGWLVIEDFDVAMGPAACLDPQSADERRANKIRVAFITLLAERGVDLTFGRNLPRELRSLGGRVEVESGPNLEHRHLCQTGDFVLTPAGVIHAPRNLSTTEPAYLIGARTDPSEHEQTVQALS